MVKDPDVGFIKEHNIEISVVFPAPLGPNIPNISPYSIFKSRLTTEKLSAPLYFFESC